MYGIQSTSKPDYDNIYQHDYYGGILQVGSTVPSTLVSIWKKKLCSSVVCLTTIANSFPVNLQKLVYY